MNGDLSNGNFEKPTVEKGTTSTLKSQKPTNPPTLSAPKIRERGEWQLMLASVLKGDVIRAEKQRLGSTEKGEFKRLDPDVSNELWLGIRSKMNGRSFAEEKLYVEEMRKTEADKILDQVIPFEVKEDDETTSAYDQAVKLLAQVDEVESLYPSRRAMIRDKPVYGSLPFQYNMDALNAWITTSRSLKLQLQILKHWTGSETLDMKGESARPFIERILKETGVLGTFDKMDVLNDLLRKTKQAMTQNAAAFAKMKLPIYMEDIQKLAQFPNNLMEEFLKVRLEYTENLMKPLTSGGPAAVGELLEDLKASLRLAARIKSDTLALNEPATGWAVLDSLSKTYDDVMMSSLRFYFKLLTWKFKATTDVSFYKEVEMLEPELEFLKYEVGPHVEGSDVEIGEQFCKLEEELLKKVTSYCQLQMNVAPGSLFLSDDDNQTTLAPTVVNPQANLTKWYKSRVLESVRARARKLLSFMKELMGEFENSAEYVLNDMDTLVKNLQDAGYILVDVAGTGKGVTPQGYLVFVSADLHKRPAQVRKLLRSCFTRRLPGEEDISDLGFAIIVSPGRDKHVRWGRGRVMKLSNPQSARGFLLKPARCRLVADDGDVLANCRERFEADVGTTCITLKKESRVHTQRVHLAVKGLKRALYSLTQTIMDSLKVVRQTIRKTGGHKSSTMSPAHDLIEDWFTFASDYGLKASKNVGGSTRRQALQLRMNRLAIEWLEFIIHDCVPTDKRTFRWSLFALEFSLKVTEDQHIYELTDEEFTLLRLNVARCMALLISHLDIQGARQSARDAAASAAEALSRKPLNLSLPPGDEHAISNGIDNLERLSLKDDWVRHFEDLEAERQRRQRSNRMIGKVLDDRNIEDRNISLLASASSSISLRWQQGKFLGGGSYGSVYMAINFDSGDVMAVKEIRFQDVTSLEALKRTIKEEMTVMQMLHHPNIVAYYGVEVHRDKLYIFMEYCPNSLASLLEHGRIEDELVIRIYTKQMLKGLEYLHSNNIVHRDVKPANTLIDAHGSIKFVDFGASKIYRNQKTIVLEGENASLIGTPHYMSPEVITGEMINMKQGAQDIWSLGCCVLEMVTGKKPWAHLDNEWAIMYHIGISNKAPPLPDVSQLSPEGIDFLSQCFIRPAKERPTATELLNHPWMQDVDENQLLLPEPLASPSIEATWGIPTPSSVMSSNTSTSTTTLPRRSNP